MFAWQVRDRILEIDQRPLIMGIVNVTPDSFSDGGTLATVEAAIARGLDMQRQGADILDIGGESTRPGAEPVPVDEELRRVLPVVEGLVHRTTLPLSIDTSKAAVAKSCLEAGAHIVNDVTGLTDPAMVEAVRSARAGAVIMHMQGTPETMQIDPRYDDVVNDIVNFLQTRVQAIEAAGVPRSCLMIDPGLGFGKRFVHNLEILARLREFRRLGLPILLGASRKGFIGKITGRSVAGSLAGTLGVASYAMSQNGVDALRVHDVQEHHDLVAIWQKLREVSAT